MTTDKAPEPSKLPQQPIIWKSSALPFDDWVDYTDYRDLRLAAIELEQRVKEMTLGMNDNYVLYCKQRQRAEKAEAALATALSDPMNVGWQHAEAARRDRESALSQWRKVIIERDLAQAQLKDALALLATARAQERELEMGFGDGLDSQPKERT